ncbi:hypothetical protein [Wolbachia endosymbiont of Trichogramma pretiosum]|uniref:hypothetical protein n=1 Tax=Wolbachia endosymbiont of Trichogramma pretiosum TaxID=125593 RepID=UPI000838E8F2|nr:hypothetical protein [Wolbachia endosymbiont of Trichogramma pretiosum]OCA07066.1 hypothetical protein wTpre_1422 [Wolbachia endosymbiont of Trichogramma pretiosum]
MVEEEVSELSREMQNLEEKTKKLEVKLQKSIRSLTENDQEIEQLKHKVGILLLEIKNKSDVTQNLNNQLKEAKNEIKLTDKINKELHQKLGLTEAELNRVRKESTMLINSIENLKGHHENQILETKKELSDIRDQLYIYLSDYKELFAELSSLQKENESLKQKNFYIGNEVSLADEINKENVREDNVSPCPDYDESFGGCYSQLFYTDEINRKEKGKDTFLLIRQKDSFSLTKVKLNTREEEKYESIWQKINKIHDYLDILGCSGSEEEYEECEKEFDKVISAALEQGIMFTFPYKSGMSLIDRIADTFQKLYLYAETTRIHEFLHKSKIFQVISEGASLNRSSDEEHEDFVNIIYSDLDTLSKRSENLLKLKELALESILNKSEQIDGHDFGLEIDNGYFCIDYPQNSIVEVARIFNNQKAKDLNLNIGILQIGNSIIRVENVGGRRNYTELSGDVIEMSFTTEVGEISIHLCPSDKDNNKKDK